MPRHIFRIDWNSRNRHLMVVRHFISPWVSSKKFGNTNLSFAWFVLVVKSVGMEGYLPDWQMWNTKGTFLFGKTNLIYPLLDEHTRNARNVKKTCSGDWRLISMCFFLCFDLFKGQSLLTSFMVRFFLGGKYVTDVWLQVAEERQSEWHCSIVLR